MDIFNALSIQLNQAAVKEEVQAENSNMLDEKGSEGLNQPVKEESQPQSSLLDNLFQKGKGLVNQAQSSLSNLNVGSTIDTAFKVTKKIVKSPSSFVAGVAATAAVYQAGGLRYGTFNQLEYVSQDTFLKNELDNAYRIG